MMEWIISSCFLILVVLVLGKLLGSHVSAKLRYGLWLLVLIRLLVPVQLYDLPGEVKTARISPVMEEKSIYVLPMNSAPVEDAGSINAHVLPDGTVAIATSMGYGRLEDDGEKVVVYMDKLSPVEFFALVWKVGAVLFAVVLFGSNLRFALGLRKRRRPYTCDCPLPVYVAGGLSSPCLFGLLSPAIYLTEEVAGEESALRHVLTHEMTHYRHLDHLWSALRCAVLAVHWWNPLVWLAVIVSKRDGELACDESALERLGEGERRAYGETLLTLVTAKTRPGDVLRCATTMTGSKKALLVRVKRIAKKQKQLLSAAILLVLVAALAAGCSFGKAQQDENAVSDNARRVVEAMFDTKNEELNYYLMMFMEVSPEVTDNGIISFDIQNYYDKWEAEIGDCFSPGTLEAVLRNYAIDAYHNLEAQGVSIELVDMERAFLDAKREEVLVTFTANGEENQVTVILRINTDGLFYRIELDPYPYDENLVIGEPLTEAADPEAPVQFPVPDGYEIFEHLLGAYVVEQGYSGDDSFPFGEDIAFRLDEMGSVPAEMVTFDAEGYPAEVSNGANSAWFEPVQRLENCGAPALLCEYRVYKDKVLYEEEWCYALCFAMEGSDRFYCFFFNPVLYDREEVVEFAPMVTFGENAFPVKE